MEIPIVMPHTCPGRAPRGTCVLIARPSPMCAPVHSYSPMYGNPGYICTDSRHTSLGQWSFLAPMHSYTIMHMYNCFLQTHLSGYRPLCTSWAYLHSSIFTRRHTASKPAKPECTRMYTCACMHEHIINTHRHKHTMHINFTHAEMHMCAHTCPCRHAPPITL